MYSVEVVAIPHVQWEENLEVDIFARHLNWRITIN